MSKEVGHLLSACHALQENRWNNQETTSRKTAKSMKEEPDSHK